MTTSRKIHKTWKSKPTMEGAGVHLHRAFGSAHEAKLFDPFLLFDDFRSYKREHFIKGFPWHPHRGIETITYVLNGDVEHGDSLKNKGVIGAGDVQWMTAGNGIIHQEMPKGDEKEQMEGFQLWANLPKSQKMMDPRYRDITSKQIPEVTLDDGVKIKVICGKVADTSGPVTDIVIEPEYLDISMPANTVYVHPTTEGHTVFAYVFEGKCFFCGQTKAENYEQDSGSWWNREAKPYADNRSLVLFTDGKELRIETKEEPARLLLVSGKPLNEPIAWYGPIVMNTQEELDTAFEEYRNGTFIKNQE
ncbi:hypothetical protein BVX94_00155 [bacterium B17]|nr:hypothetical protein BVX94_00155 [bacterium B17]